NRTIFYLFLRSTLTGADHPALETVKKPRFSSSLSIETTLSIEFATANRALWAQFSVVLYKNPRTGRGFL
ncbi:hypothetical protein, partial [Agathobaculum desmolans]|uniref:hypothetical protein n=1 Tax=Agathobaculum desmolans TaxID=39484 RepID=UPI00248E49CD